MRITLAMLALLAACSPAARENGQGSTPAASAPAAAPGAPANEATPTDTVPVNHAAALPPVEPAPPGTPGGLPDDRTPVSEAPFSETSAQGAANVLQTYYALIEAHRYGDAWRLWGNGGRASGMSAADFAASFDLYADYHAQIGAPGRIEGAAGSLYVQVPVALYGRLRSGEAFHMAGPVTLGRVNDVPGSSAAQRRWHIEASGIRPRRRGG
jgi:hypothetical protein